MSKITNPSNISRQGYFGANCMGFRRREAAYFKPNTGSKLDNLKEKQKIAEIKKENHLPEVTTQELPTNDVTNAQITEGDKMKDTEMIARLRK